MLKKQILEITPNPNNLSFEEEPKILIKNILISEFSILRDILPCIQKLSLNSNKTQYNTLAMMNNTKLQHRRNWFFFRHTLNCIN